MEGGADRAICGGDGAVEGASGILARNLTALVAARTHHPDWLVVADWSLNAINPLAAAELLRLGADRITCGLDASDAAQQTIRCALPPGRVEALRYYHAALFYTQYCPYSHHLSSGQCYPDCAQPCRNHSLKFHNDDHVSLSLRRDGVGRIELFDLHPTEPHSPEGPAQSVRIELLDETAEEIAALLPNHDGSLRKKGLYIPRNP